MDIEQARFNMVEQQIRTWDVLEPRVLEAVAAVRREEYVPLEYKDLAFADIRIPIGHGEVMLEPKLTARLVQELGVKPRWKVLEIGTGTGYGTALLACLAGEVTSVEIHPDLSADAGRNLAMAGFSNVTLAIGDAADGWLPGDGEGEPGSGSEDHTWDGIVITGSLPRFPGAYLDMLAPGGTLIAIVGSEPAMAVRRYHRVGGGIREKSLFETVVPPLRNARPISAFEF